VRFVVADARVVADAVAGVAGAFARAVRPALALLWRVDVSGVTTRDVPSRCGNANTSGVLLTAAVTVTVVLLGVIDVRARLLAYVVANRRIGFLSASK
jgi:hypothetical protein